jgi:hypothetical protein
VSSPVCCLLSACCISCLLLAPFPVCCRLHSCLLLAALLRPQPLDPSCYLRQTNSSLTTARPQIEFKGADLKFITLFTGANGPGIIADTDGQGTQFTMSNADCFWSSVYLESLMVMLIIPVRDFFDRFHYNH